MFPSLLQMPTNRLRLIEERVRLCFHRLMRKQEKQKRQTDRKHDRGNEADADRATKPTEVAKPTENQREADTGDVEAQPKKYNGSTKANARNQRKRQQRVTSRRSANRR